jgi:hypothetical protein
MAKRVQQDRKSRYGAMLIALGVQVFLIVLVLGGLDRVPVLRDDAPALSVFLVPPNPPEREIRAPPAAQAHVAVHLRKPSVPPLGIPPDLVLPPSAPARIRIPSQH